MFRNQTTFWKKEIWLIDWKFYLISVAHLVKYYFRWLSHSYTIYIVATASKNTLKNTKWAWNAFEQRRLNRSKVAKSNIAPSLSEILPITKDLPLNVMIETLQYFVTEARKQNGSPYPPVTWHNLYCGLLRKCREQGIIEILWMKGFEI